VQIASLLVTLEAQGTQECYRGSSALSVTMKKDPPKPKEGLNGRTHPNIAVV
jgi:hypothetical protein